MLSVRLEVDGVLRARSHEVKWGSCHGVGLQPAKHSWPVEALQGGNMPAGAAWVGWRVQPDLPGTLVAVYASGARLARAQREAPRAPQRHLRVGPGAAATEGALGRGEAGPAAGPPPARPPSRAPAAPAAAGGGVWGRAGPAASRSRLGERMSCGEDALGRWVLVSFFMGRTRPVPRSLTLSFGPLTKLLPDLFSEDRAPPKMAKVRLQVRPHPTCLSPIPIRPSVAPGAGPLLPAPTHGHPHPNCLAYPHWS
jgi:hypothetical protein